MNAVSPAVEMRGITKRYGAFTALELVDLVVDRGTIHAVVGENGAGKTTLMKALFGVIGPDSGTIAVEGEARTFRSSKEALAAGLGMVSQHYAIIPELSNLQNLILGAEEGPLISRKAAETRANAIMHTMGFAFDWAKPSGGLSPGDAQKLEILKLLWRNARIMILDEPTAMLSPADSDMLFGSLRRLVDGGATVILVTHRVAEVLEHAKSVTVLRAGKGMGTFLTADLTPSSLAELIIGESPPRFTADPPSPGAVRLSAQGLSAKGERGNLACRDVTFALSAGEVVGIAGVDGNGQRELFEMLMGTRRTESGQLSLNGDSVINASPRARLAAGMACVPEDRHAEAVVEGWNLSENAILTRQRFEPISRKGTLQSRAISEWTKRVISAFDVRNPGVKSAIGSLSGGNQQRFVVGRVLESDPKVILAFQPTRGLDLKATARIYERIRHQCRAGNTGLIVSFDLEELIQYCDRILVMRDGELLDPGTNDRTVIGRLMVGGA